MVDHDLILAKAGLIRRHLKRVSDKASVDLKKYLKDLDLQDLISFNLHLAIENCIDLAAHVISEEGLGVPGSASEMFYLLEENNYLSPELTEKMIKAVGLRNLIVHEYGKIELKRLFEIVHKDTQDLKEYTVSILTRFGIADDNGV